MNKTHIRLRQSIAAGLILLGLVLGVNWPPAGRCLGDTLFRMAGLPVWSQGTTGTHYPGVLGIILIISGITAVNSTPEKRSRLWLWVCGITAIYVLTVLLAFV